MLALRAVHECSSLATAHILHSRYINIRHLADNVHIRQASCSTMVANLVKKRLARSWLHEKFHCWATSCAFNLHFVKERLKEWMCVAAFLPCVACWLAFNSSRKSPACRCWLQHLFSKVLVKASGGPLRPVKR